MDTAPAAVDEEEWFCFLCCKMDSDETGLGPRERKNIVMTDTKINVFIVVRELCLLFMN